MVATVPVPTVKMVVPDLVSVAVSSSSSSSSSSSPVPVPVGAAPEAGVSIIIIPGAPELVGGIYSVLVVEPVPEL